MGEFNWEERLKAEYAELKKRYEKLRVHNIRLEVKANLAQTKNITHILYHKNPEKSSDTELFGT